MRSGGVFRSSRAVLVAFLAVAVLSSGLLGALGWMLLRQDRELEQTRTDERLAQARDSLAAWVRRSLDVRHLVAGQGTLAQSGAILITIDGSRIAVDHGALVYYPYEPVREAPAQVFSEGERFEYRIDDQSAAAREYRRLAASNDAAVRAGALGRLARVQRKSAAVDDALLTYGLLDAIEQPVTIDGFPVTLYSRLGRAGALEKAGRSEALRQEARALASDLRQGRWALSRAEYLARHDEVGRWLGTGAIDDDEGVGHAEAVEWLWQNRDSLTSSSQSARNRLRAGIAGPTYLSAVVADVGAETSARRTLLTTALVAIGLVLAAGWYFIVRAIAREQRIAQLQTDFVSAVSHEFRSPLTSMAHLAEMLDTGRVPSDETRRTSYGVLVRDTNRLRRLVEDLLDFQGFETGTSTLHLEPVDLVDLVRSLAGEFQGRVAPAGYTIELIAPQTPIQIAADRDALARALGNLIDNAIKYSPESRTIWVELTRESGRIAISVRDHGIGIPLDEQRHIFDRFVRGAQPKAMRIRGTGIGLAMVRHIVRAHGGEVRVESEPGGGSRFTIVLRDAAGAAA